MITSSFFNKIFLFLLCLTSLNCSKKDSQQNIEIKDVTGYTWEIFSVQKTTDGFTNPLPVNWQFKLNADQSFLITLQGQECKGRYTWVQIDSANANLSFTIDEWQSPATSNQVTVKLKEIMPSITSCHYLKTPFTLPIPGFLNQPSIELLFSGTEGSFYVLRW